MDPPARPCEPDAIPPRFRRLTARRCGNLARYQLLDCAHTGSGRPGVVLALAPGELRGGSRGAGPDVRAGCGPGFLWSDSAQRVLRQSVPRSRSPATPTTRIHGRDAPEPGG